MPNFLPFSALTYKSHGPDLTLLSCPPYDVISTNEREQLARKHEKNAVHVEVPDPRANDKYKLAAKLFRQWIESGVLEYEQSPSYYALEMIDDSNNQTTRGIIGRLDVDSRDQVLGHEQTISKDKTDRLELIKNVLANTSPIWTLAPNTIYSDLDLFNATPLFYSEYGGVTYRLFRISHAETANRIRRAIEDQTLLIADGHHRFEVAKHFFSTSGDKYPGAKYVMAFLTELDGKYIHISPIHRILSPEHFTLDEISEILESKFAINRIDAEINSLLDYHRQGYNIIATAYGAVAFLTPRPEDQAPTEILEESLQLSEKWPIYLNSTSDAIAEFQHDDLRLLFLLQPVSIERIKEVANSKRLLPPKSTLFTPKPLTGLVFNDLLID